VANEQEANQWHELWRELGHLTCLEENLLEEIREKESEAVANRLESVQERIGAIVSEIDGLRSKFQIQII
jgi:ABC-type Fe2+-enterobactin transport system substrate-binding protein